MRIPLLHYIFPVVILFTITTNRTNAQEVLIDILKEELHREMEFLKNEDYPPYFMDYRVNELSSSSLSSSFGSLINDSQNKGRILSTSVRIGNYALDNTREVDGVNGSKTQSVPRQLPLDNESLAIKQILWQSTRYEYQNAVASYNGVHNKIKRSDNDISKTPDFSKESSQIYIERIHDTSSITFDKNKWIKRIKELSSLFLIDESIFAGNVDLEFWTDKKYYVSTEGTKVIQSSTYAHLYITGAIKAKDGNVIPLIKSYYSFKPKDLPSNKIIESDILKLITKLQELKEAPIADAYSGPAILSAEAAGVFFHEIFGHRIEGHRLKSDFDGQTFTGKIEERILPKNLNIICDPTLNSLNGQDLIGYYKYDDQGVKASKVNIVENGILKNFLMSRSPIDGNINSNGHGRAQPGAIPVTRQSNLIISTNKPLSNKSLRKKLIKACKKQDKEYGYFIKDVIGGFTSTDRYSPNVFNIHPTEVYRVYVDGRPDELVRGVELIGTPLAMFATIAEAGNQQGIFTGMCGAESGYVPVTAISPAILVKQIETQKQPKSYEQLPILTRPQAEKDQTK